ncbi:MAG: hypothetical protein LBD90_01835 [Bifidobacteriaceae bacterium]|jgi:hypothetical protein|nr:hypothetical protein [Bifidobacteriaceae bacterium]
MRLPAVRPKAVAAAVVAAALMVAAGCADARPPGFQGAARLDFEALQDSGDSELRQAGPRIVVIEDDAELARRRPAVDYWSRIGEPVDFDLGSPERIPADATALWFYAGDLPDGCGRSEVTAVYSSADEWAVAVRLFEPKGDGGCSDAVVPVTGLLLVWADAPARVSLQILSQTSPDRDHWGWGTAPQAAS